MTYNQKELELLLLEHRKYKSSAPTANFNVKLINTRNSRSKEIPVELSKLLDELSPDRSKKSSQSSSKLKQEEPYEVELIPMFQDGYD